MEAIRDIERRIDRQLAAEISGAGLRAAREAKGIRPSAVARTLGVSRQYVYKIESAEVVTVETATAYLAALKTK